MHVCVPHLVGSAVGVFQLNVGLLPDAVQVFVESVQQEGQQLMRVLLLIARKLRRESTHLSLKHQQHRDVISPNNRQRYLSVNVDTSSSILTLKGRGVT